MDRAAAQPRVLPPKGLQLVGHHPERRDRDHLRGGDAPIPEVLKQAAHLHDLFVLKMRPGRGRRDIEPLARQNPRLAVRPVEEVGALGIVQTTMDLADHHAVIGHLVAQAEHRVVAPAVHRQRHAHPHRLLALTQGGAVARRAVGEGLDRRPRRDPCRGDAEGGGDVALGLARHRDNRLQLQRVADGDDPLGAPDPPDGVLRGRLPGFVDEQPAEGLDPETRKHAADGGEGRRDHRHGQEEDLPRRQQLLGLKVARVSAGHHLDGRAQSLQHVIGRVGQEVLMEPHGRQEQLGASLVEPGVEPRGALLTSLPRPRPLGIGGPVRVMVLGHPRAQPGRLPGRPHATRFEGRRLIRQLARPPGEVVRMAARPPPVLLRCSQPVLKRFQARPPLADGAPQGEERLERAGPGLDLPVPDRARLGALRLRVLDDGRVRTALANGRGGLCPLPLRLRGELGLLPEGDLQAVQAILGGSPLREELIDAPLGPAEVLPRPRPAGARRRSIPPLAQTRLHARNGSRDALLRVRVGDVEPERRPEVPPVPLVAQSGGDQSPGPSSCSFRPFRFSCPSCSLRRLLLFLSDAGGRQSRGGDIREVVGVVPPPGGDRLPGGDLDADILDGGVVSRGDDHLESGELRAQLADDARIPVAGRPPVRGRRERVLGALQRGETPCALDDVAGEDVAQHRRLAGAGRPVDAHEAADPGQVVQCPVDGELLPQRQPVLGVGGPSALRQPVDPDPGIDDGVLRHDVRPQTGGKQRIGGQVGRQRRRAAAVRQGHLHGREIVEEEAVEEVDVRSRVAGAAIGDDDRRDDDPLAGQPGCAGDPRGLVSDAQQRPQGALVLGRGLLLAGPLGGGLLGTRLLGPGRLTAESLDNVHLLLELLGGQGESAGPLRARRHAGIPDPSDGPQRRGERRGVDHQHPAVVEHDRCAGADPGTALVVGVPVLGEGMMQVLIDVLEVVQAEVDGVLPSPFRFAHRRRRAQVLPRQGIT